MNNTMDTNELSAKILFIMASRRRINPITSRDLESQLGVKGPAIRESIRLLRRNGEPIVATENGYFYAENIEDVKEIIRDLEGRATSMLKTAKSIRDKALLSGWDNRKDLFEPAEPVELDSLI